MSTARSALAASSLRAEHFIRLTLSKDPSSLGGLRRHAFGEGCVLKLPTDGISP
jgi:hypothetical protein